ncbi:MAG TPA: 50S ribosomal protein L13 [bacterium]|nr:50S ribosomal protein L13 [bacterium]
MPKQIAGNERKWFVVDAEGQNLGRLATLIATVIRGKNRVDFSPHVDNGDYVIVLNADKIAVTGNKEEDKFYRTHSGYMGGLNEKKLSTMRVKKPAEILRLAVIGMLPKNRQRSGMVSRLKLETGTTHQYEAQKPQPLI